MQYTVKLVERIDVREFVEQWHYSGTINGVMADYCFGLYNRQGELVGVALYGKLGMANAWKKYACKPEQVLELRRLCLVDEAPTNSESWFIGQTLRWLKRHTKVDVVVSYADTNQGHEGVIYQATNFLLVGKTAPGKVILHNGKKYHDKAIRTKYKGELKPFAKRLKDALEIGEAYYIPQKPKNIYVKLLRKRRGRSYPKLRRLIDKAQVRL